LHSTPSGTNGHAAPRPPAPHGETASRPVLSAPPNRTAKAWLEMVDKALRELGDAASLQAKEQVIQSAIALAVPRRTGWSRVVVGESYGLWSCSIEALCRAAGDLGRGVGNLFTGRFSTAARNVLFDPFISVATTMYKAPSIRALTNYTAASSAYLVGGT